MKKIIALLCACALSSFAQKNTEFQAFAGEFLKIGDMKGGYHSFSMPVKGEGWAFQAEGQVQAPAGDPYVLLDGVIDGLVYAVIAYVPAVAAGTDAKDYQVGMFDMMIYLEDEAVKVRDVKFKLLPPANDEWALDMARDAAEIGNASKATLWNGSHDVEITRTAAVPLTKKDLQPAKPKPAARKLPPPPAQEVEEAAEVIRTAANTDINTIFGAVINENLNDEVIVTVIATGFDKAPKKAPEPPTLASLSAVPCVKT